MSGDKQFVVLDGKEGTQYDTVLTNGGGRLIFESVNTLRYMVMKEKKYIYIIEEKLN
jgi:hypothetical protein